MYCKNHLYIVFEGKSQIKIKEGDKFALAEQWSKSVCLFCLQLSSKYIFIDWWETMCQPVPLDNVKLFFIHLIKSLWFQDKWREADMTTNIWHSWWYFQRSLKFDFILCNGTIMALPFRLFVFTPGIVLLIGCFVMSKEEQLPLWKPIFFFTKQKPTGGWNVISFMGPQESWMLSCSHKTHCHATVRVWPVATEGHHLVTLWLASVISLLQPV